MADDGKKVSFGFAKSIKKSALKNVAPPEEKKVDYIECLDAKSIKVVGEEEKIDGPLVIPLLGSKTWHDRISNRTDADIFEPKTREGENKIVSKVANGDARVDEVGTTTMNVSEIKKEKSDPTESVARTLEEQAASEIIQELRSEDIKTEDPNLEVPIAENETLRGTQESTLEDYEQIPIDAFGLAMLRGMGWKPGKGIGKNEKLVVASLPELRPRGMGLGADRATLRMAKTQQKTKEEEQLKLEKGSFVRIIAGKEANNYGQIEGFDDEAGRLIVKMALGGESQSLNECLIQAVTKTEYTKNSKVLNATKYEEYRNKGAKKERDETRISTPESEISNDDDAKKRREDDGGENSRIAKKKMKKRTRYSSEEREDSDKRKRRDSSDGERDCRRGRAKKLKKSHKRSDDTSNGSRKKKKKSDGARERKSEYSNISDRKKHKRHKRSRSRSPAKR